MPFNFAVYSAFGITIKSANIIWNEIKNNNIKHSVFDISDISFLIGNSFSNTTIHILY